MLMLVVMVEAERDRDSGC